MLSFLPMDLAGIPPAALPPFRPGFGTEPPPELPLGLPPRPCRSIPYSLFYMQKGELCSPFFLWTWRESNPRPKALSLRPLPSQSLYLYSLNNTPNDRLIILVASYLLPEPQSFGPGVPRRFDARPLSSGILKADKQHLGC